MAKYYNHLAKLADHNLFVLAYNNLCILATVKGHNKQYLGEIVGSPSTMPLSPYIVVQVTEQWDDRI